MSPVRHRNFKLGIAIGVLTLALLMALPAGVALAGTGHSARITGHVTDKATGDPVESVSADVYLLSHGSWSLKSDGFTDSSGYYDIGELAAGTYRVLFQDGSGYYGMQYYKGKWTFASATNVTVGAGAVKTGIDVALVEAAHITGEVTDKVTGDPIGGIRVDALLSDGSTLSSLHAFSDSSGYYDVGGLTAGTYRVVFDDESGYYARQYDDHKPLLTLARRLTVGTAGSADGVDAALVEAETDPPLTGDDAPTGWQTIGANVTLTPTDAGSGIFATYYKLNGGTAKTYTGPIAVFAQGANTIEYWSVDWAGNTESAHKASFIVFAAPSGNGTPSTPSTPSTVKHGASFTTFGCIAHHAPGTSPVTLQFYQLQHGRWVLRKSTTAKASGIAGFSFSKYSDTTSLASAGQWRVRAQHKSGSHFQYSGYRTFTVS